MKPFSLAHFGAACTILFFAACGSGKTYVAPSETGWAELVLPEARHEVHRLYLVGDIGDRQLAANNPVARAVRQSASRAGVPQTLLLLGDNVYCCGLPDSAAAGRSAAEATLRTQLSIMADLPDSRTVIIPGNHDWNNSRPGGLDALRRQQRFVEREYGDDVMFLPTDGFPGPEKVKVHNDIVVLAIDTEWWLTRHSKSYGDAGSYDIDEDLDFIVQLEDEISRNAGDIVIVAGHHPLRTLGDHGGVLRPRAHLFPLLRFHPGAYVPLPVLGTLYVLASRQFGLSRQDSNHPRYRGLRRALGQIFGAHEELVYVSGHDHSLQLFEAEGGLTCCQHYIVSGAGSRPKHVGRGRGARFTHSSLGYSSLHYYEDGSLWAAFWEVQHETARTRLLFRKRLVQGREPAEPLPQPEGPVLPADSTIRIAANPAYSAGGVKKFFLGSHHRELWSRTVELPVLDIGRVAGGLTPVKRGGGLQTVSLRLEAEDGTEYVLRSIDKDPSSTVPEPLQGTVATDIVQDAISSLHPFGALIIPTLASAAGVYHTTPRLVYVPDDPRLGPYRERFGDRFMMIEIRPDGDMSRFAEFGNSEKVISAHDMYRRLTDDNDDRVDAQAFIRVRLFDMLLSDWDRHRDQWRWASFDDPDGRGDLFRPIPRDRDWAFNRMNGLLPALLRVADPKFQSFGPTFGNIKGLTINGLEQDRRLTAGMTKQDWVAAAESLQQALTDEVIDEAVRAFPPPVYETHGPGTADLLKQRRAHLVEVAEQYYRLLARVVDVVGSDKHERFYVHRMSDGRVEVTVQKTRKDGEVRQELYRRVFSPTETVEIRLFGLDGNDRFLIEGDAGRSIRIVAIGGPGDDEFVDTSRARGRGAWFIDTPAGAKVTPGQDARVTLTERPLPNLYDPREFKHDLLLPQVFFGANPDDGVFIGGGVKTILHGFKRIPYASTHRLVGNVAARTAAFNLVYSGRWNRAVRRWDRTLDVELLSPNNVHNFYGLGNETDNTEGSSAFYQARLTRFNIQPGIARPVGSRLQVLLGPRLLVTRVKEDADRFVAVTPGISEDTFDDQWHAGAVASLTADFTDIPNNPRQGFRFRSTAGMNVGVRNTESTYVTSTGDLSLYVSPSLRPQLTVALRVGASHIVGDFPFYEASTLGGARNLRGFRSTRFAGRTAFYQNAELRGRLFSFRGSFLVGDLGALGFLDNGRVWTDDESSGVWHQGYGGGLWANLFQSMTLASWIGASEDDQTFTLRFGFQY